MPSRSTRWLWPLVATPGTLWLLVFLVAPAYVVLAILFGGIDPILRRPVPVWNPIYWDPAQFTYVLSRMVGEDAFFGPAIVRTGVYVAIASALCVLIAYPVAYYAARVARRRRGLLLAALIAPFWISYMMRMLAWVNLLQNDGLVNQVITLGGLWGTDVDWLGGQHVTVVLGLTYGYVPYMILPLYAGLDRIPTSVLEAGRDLGANRFQVWRRVTWPMSQAAVVAAVILTCLPMLGDYFTSDLLSGNPRTSMIGNLINSAVLTPGQTGQAAAFVMLVLLVALVPMGLYIRVTRTAEETRCVTTATVQEAPEAAVRPSRRPRRPRRRRRGARGPRAPFLATVTGLYLLWSLGPVLIAVLFSFNAGRSRTQWQGFSLRWYLTDPLRSVAADEALQTALVHTFRLGLLVTIICVPLGTLLALGLDRWRGRLPAGASFLVLLSFVLPEVLLAVSLLFVATTVNAMVWTPVQLGTMGQVIGLVTFELSYPVIIVRARLLTIGRQYEEAAVDLGASPLGAVRRVLLPMTAPAILASAVLVFADVIDDFVLVRYLSGGSGTEPVAVKIYNTARAAPTPALNAIATLVLVASLLAVFVGYLVYRRLTRGERGSGIEAFTGEA